MTLSFKSVDRLMQDGLDRFVFPGAVLQVMAGGQMVYKRAYGWADLFCRAPMTVDTVFDLASLTKPLATVPAVMALVGQGRLDLDRACGDLSPGMASGEKAFITVKQLLKHCSGLPACRPFFMRLRHLEWDQRPAALRRMVLAEPLMATPGERSEYSDLGFMLLQWVVETLCGQSLDRFIAREVYAPLGIEDLFFNDTRRDVPDADRYAATQLCPWRCRLMKGQVDDDNAWAVGGVAGHAGLFGTADAVCRFLQVLAAADQGDTGPGVFNTELVRAFFEAPAGDRWALGFDTPDAVGSSAGRHFPIDSIGHLGFTGTSFWINRGRGVIVVLLTNRVHPFRFNNAIKAFRPLVHDAVMEAFEAAG